MTTKYVVIERDGLYQVAKAVNDVVITTMPITSKTRAPLQRLVDRRNAHLERIAALRRRS